MNVVNQTGGSDVVGPSAIVKAEPDGYTIGMAMVEIGTMHWHWLTDLTWEDYTLLTLVNFDPAAVHVRADPGCEDPTRSSMRHPPIQAASAPRG